MSSLPSPADAPADAPTHHWDELARRLEDFLTAWEKVEQTEERPPPSKIICRLSLRRFAAWCWWSSLSRTWSSGRGQGRQIPATRDRTRSSIWKRTPPSFPNCARVQTGEPPVELIYEEYHVRRTSGGNVSVKEYVQRFPKARRTPQTARGRRRFLLVGRFPCPQNRAAAGGRENR